MLCTEHECEYYRLEDGSTINREYGNPFSGAWVYRNIHGDLIDFDQYKNDLFERNNLREV